jgi:hypothetical protein
MEIYDVPFELIIKAFSLGVAYVRLCFDFGVPCLFCSLVLAPRFVYLSVLIELPPVIRTWMMA